jgi:tetratricopeptide (TPR) repeat protein
MDAVSTTGPGELTHFLKRTLLVLYCLVPLLTLLASDSQPQGSILFINTSPIRARVILDGKELAERTPLLVRSVEQGAHKVQIIKEGYSDYSASFSLSQGEKKTIELELKRSFFHQSFPGETTILLNREEEPSKDEIFLFQQGQYDIRRTDDRLAVASRYPEQAMIDGLNLAVPISLFLSGVLTAGEILFPSNVNRPFSPIVITSHAISLTLISLDVAFHIRKNRFMRSNPYEVRTKRGLQPAQEYYRLGERYLAEEKMDAALDAYSRALAVDSDSSLLAPALYKIAKIHHIKGETAMALSEYTALVNDYPTSQLYDKARKSLADLCLTQDRFEDSLRHLDSMVYIDPLYSEQEIDLLRCEIFERWYTRDETRLEQLIEAYREMVGKYVEEKNSDLYLYKLAYYLFESGDREESNEVLSLIGNLEIEPGLEQKIRELKERIQQAGP